MALVKKRLKGVRNGLWEGKKWRIIIVYKTTEVSKRGRGAPMCAPGMIKRGPTHGSAPAMIFHIPGNHFKYGFDDNYITGCRAAQSQNRLISGL